MNTRFVSLEPVEKYNIVLADDKWQYRKIAYGAQSIANEIACSSVWQAIRHLKKHNEIPNGVKFRLVDENGNNIILEKK
jgi:hypothetical protein